MDTSLSAGERRMWKRFMALIAAAALGKAAAKTDFHRAGREQNKVKAIYDLAMIRI